MNILRRIAEAISALAMAAALPGCHQIDNHRLPVAYVNLQFWTAADWDIWGVTGAGQHRRFIIQELVPSGFPYPASATTGLGGILLCSTYLGEPVAYDLACPVECRANVRVFINENSEAECPVCHSRYDVFEKLGHPISGPAMEQGYGLEVYRVGPGVRGEYMVVSR
ncbi:MAG: hypothetical protein K2M19_07305 [Muribaculaceae bacterium]|nr:hypothetical protein [Muribaculaceae bacterium]